MSSSTTPPPAHLGRYRVIRRLGAGGMAEVFLAKTSGAEGIEKVLVVKRVLPTFARSAKFIAMFVDEAKVAMRLNHPNIVQVYAFEQARDELVLAMEFVDGLDLGRLLSSARRQGRHLTPALAAYLVMEVAKGLDYAHARRDESGEPMDIVHRDVSPQNVLISYDGVVKVADFGIARARLVSEETGVIKGKFSYMSPEQARGHRVDRRSDVYSLGILLAELLMNRAMYPGQQGMEVLDQVRDGRMTLPRKVDATVPVELEQIVARAAAFEREDRFPTARAMAIALSRWLHAQDELVDATNLERFVGEVAPREVTSPDGRGATSAGIAETQASLQNEQRELRERRNVVVVHGALRGEAMAGDPKLHKPRSAAAQALRVLEDIAYKYGAILDWLEGRGHGAFRFLLGLGRVSVDDPLHATRLAADVLEALNGLSADLLVPLTTSLGLSRGTVSTVRSPGGRLRYQPVEAVFDVARDLGEAGRDGEILVSGEVYRLARRAFAFDEGELREVSIDHGPVRRLRAYRLRGARTREERAAEALAVSDQAGLIGRSMEIRALFDLYREVVSSRRSAYMAVVGELGVGKTAVVGAALGSFRPDPRLLRVECLFGSTEVPFSTVAELVREACGIHDDTSPADARKLLDDTLNETLPPSLRESARDALGPLVGAVPATDDSRERSSSLTRAVRLLLGGLAARGPLVVWIDALQFADAPTLQLMERLLAQSYEAPLMVVISSRSDERVEALLANVPRIDLEELDDDDRRALVAARFGEAHVAHEIQQAIVHRAGGNPFFITELIDALLERGVVWVEGDGTEKRVQRRSGASFALPTTVEDVITARVAELPEHERRTLRWLSVTGPGLRSPELRAISGEDQDAAVASLEERGLLQRRVGGGLFFPSAVVRHVAYESIDASDRPRMHRAVAQHLSGLGATVPPARLAHHREQAGDRAGAAEAFLAAGRSAQAMYSHEDALRFLSRVLALVPPSSEEAFAAHEAREQTFRVLGRRQEQRQELEALRAVAERSRNPRQLAIAFSRIARFDLDAARPAGVEALLRRALDASIEGDDKASEIETLRLFGQLRCDQGDTSGAVEALDRALARAGLDREFLSARGQTLVQKAILLWRAGRVEPSLEASAEAVVIFRRLGLKALEAHALSSMGLALSHRGAFEDAIQVIRSSILLDREVGDRLHLGRKVSNVGQLYAELGDVTNAQVFLRRALDVFQAFDDQSGHADTLSALAELHYEQLADIEGAEGYIRQARTIAARIQDPYDMAHAAMVEAALELDRAVAAASTVAQPRSDASRTGADAETAGAPGRAPAPVPSLAGVHSGATAVALDRGSAERAEKIARDAVFHARAAGARGYELLAMAVRAEALARLGRTDDSVRLAREVRTELDTHRELERAERILYRLFRALRTNGQLDLATRAVADARGVVASRLAQIRDDRLRDCYQKSNLIRSIRAEQA